MERREFAFLEALAVFIEAKTIVEVGVQVGNMAVHLCRAAEKNTGNYYGFDLWGTHGLKSQFEAQGSLESVSGKLKAAGLSSYTLLQVDTLNKREHFIESLKSLCPNGIDFAFIDACHSYHGIANDFFAVYPMLNLGGVVVFHDTLRIDGCREFVLDLRTKYNNGFFDITDYPYGMGERRCGISVLTKRSFAQLNIGIDEICGSNSTPAEIEYREARWLASEVASAGGAMPSSFNEPILVSNLGYCTRNKFE